MKYKDTVTFLVFRELISKGYDGVKRTSIRYMLYDFQGCTCGIAKITKQFKQYEQVSGMERYTYGIGDAACSDYSISLWDAQQWLRDKHNIEISVWKEYNNEFSSEHYAFRIYTQNYESYSQDFEQRKTYESALNAAISEALTLVRKR